MLPQGRAYEDMVIKTKRISDLLTGWMKLSVLSLIFLSFFVAGGAVRAETELQDLTPIILTDTKHEYFLGPQSLSLPGAESSELAGNVLSASNLGSIAGQDVQRKILSHGLNKQGRLFLTRFINNTRNEDWVLNLGQMFDGRHGILKNVKLYVFVNEAAGSQKPSFVPEKMGAPVSEAMYKLEFRPGQSYILGLYLETESSVPATLPLKLISEARYLQTGFQSMTPKSLMTLFLLGAGLFFLSLTAIKKSWAYISFTFYYAVLAIYLNWPQFAEGYYDPVSLFFPFIIGAIAIGALWTSKSFLTIEYDNYGEKYALYGFMITLAFSAIFAAFFSLDMPVMRSFFTFIPPVAAIIVIAVLSYAQTLENHIAGQPYLWAWVIMIAGLMITASALTGLLVPTSLTLNAFWFSLIPQVFLFALASTTKLDSQEEELKRHEKMETQYASASAKVKQSKEASEYARLLKVIEREREVMGELREKEARRAEEMRKAKEAADIANRAKSAFLAVVSHEIRTPMTGIMGMVRLLLDSSLSKDQKDHVLTIQESGDAMLALLNDILDFEKIEQGKMELEKVSFHLPRLIQNVVMLMNGHAAQKGITLKAEIDEGVPKFVKGDPTRLRQVLLNLTGNAIKFTSEGQVIIHVGVTNTDDDAQTDQDTAEIYFAVEDNGIGISQDAQKNLFSPFAQADSSIARKFGGTGLGLAISKGLIEAMGSTISLRSQENEGSTFFFTLEMEKSSSEQAESIKDEQDSAALPTDSINRILIVDDNHINRKVILSFLSREHHEVDTAENAHEALEKIQSQKYDLIFMDIEMPGMNGDEAARTIRSFTDEDIAATPIIAVTGNVMKEDKDRYFAAGINDLLPKPITPESVQDLMKKVTDGHMANPDMTVDDSYNFETENTQTAGGNLSEDEDEDEKTKQNDDKNILPGKSFEDEIDLDTETGLSFADPAMDDPENIAEPKSPELIIAEMGINEHDLEKDTFTDALEEMERKKLEEQQAAGNGQESAPVFDDSSLSALKGHLGHDQLMEMLTEVIDKTQEIIESLDQATSENDLKKIAGKAHELKGMAGNFGLKEISELAARAEKKAKGGETQGLDDLLAGLPEAKDRAARALTQWAAA